MAFHKAGQLAQAETLYRQVLQSDPNHAEALHFLGLVAYQTGRCEEAVLLMDRALRVAPTSQMYSNRGVALQALERLDEAIGSYRDAIALDPSFSDAHYNLGLLYKTRGLYDEAVASFETVLSLNAGNADALNNTGAVLRDMGRPEDAIACYRRALAINPNFAGAYNNMGVAYKDLGRAEEAIACYRRAIELLPDGPAVAVAYVNLGNAMGDLGRIEDAATLLRKALAHKPDDGDGYSSLLFYMAFQSVLPPEVYLDLARGWENACLDPRHRAEAARRRFDRRPLRGRRLRLGYLSGDYREHAVGSFLKSIFSLHDRERVELFAYSTSGRRDGATESYRRLSDHWVSLVGLQDDAAARRIDADGIDVLIDLSGHTAHNRIGIFAHRAAPVQAHYLGFWASTGITEMDYWIADAILIPPELDPHYSEQVWRLPRVWVAYEGSDKAPLPAWKPDERGFVWLGSFNNLAKINAPTLALWAKILVALPEGRLLLKTKDLADAGNRHRVLDALAAGGVAPERIELRDSGATLDWPSHMAYYDRLDMALDPIGGVGGGTTTCDALWMSVPLVTLEGERMASRMTTSMLHAIGHPEWIARSEDEYVRKVVALARDAGRRRLVRATLREEVARSPLCDARGLTRSLEEAYFAMFERWQASARSATWTGPAPPRDAP